jgi:hypothetical protein
VVPLGEQGTYYPTATISDTWGTIEVSGGILVANDFRSAKVTAPVNPAAPGPRWKLNLAQGWRLEPGKRKGDYTLVSGAR